MMKVVIVLYFSITIASQRIEGEITNSSLSTTSASTTSKAGERSDSNKTSSSSSWYGREYDSEDVIGCKWPRDFEQRYEFCASRTAIDADFGTDAQFGLLDKNLVEKLLEQCSDGKCAEAKINRTEFVARSEQWFHHADNISAFGQCLKKNTEGMVHLCSASDQVSQTVSGFAGLHLSLIEIINGARKHMQDKMNDTEACLGKLSEAIHFTSILYMESRFYSENKVLCWEARSKGECSPSCKQFAYMLECVKSVCPTMNADLKTYGIWQWYYGDNYDLTKRTCDVKVDDAQCHSDVMAVVNPVTTPAPPTDLLSKSKAVVEQIGEKVKGQYNNFHHWVESTTHMKFYKVMLMSGGALAVFIGTVVALCMWYNGLICQRRKRRTLRYAKLVPDHHLGRRDDESKSLTRDYDADDIE